MVSFDEISPIIIPELCVCGGGGVNVAFCKLSKYLMTAYDIWNECFNKIYIVFTFKYQLAIWFFIIQSKQLHAFNSHEFLSYLQTMWQFLKSNVRSSESPAKKCMGWGWKFGGMMVYGFILNHTWIKFSTGFFHIWFYFNHLE